jgi:hypothetical protein
LSNGKIDVFINAAVDACAEEALARTSSRAPDRPE